jgi:hypothetical protein
MRVQDRYYENNEQRIFFQPTNKNKNMNKNIVKMSLLNDY